MEAAQEEKKGGNAPKPRAAAFVFKPSGYVPPAPKGGKTIPKPTNTCGDSKTFTTSDGKAPWMMNLPGIESEEKPEIPEGVEADGSGGGEPVEDGLTPEQRRRRELEEDPGFKTYLRMVRMRIPLINIRRKLNNEGMKYTFADLDMFSDKEEIDKANSCIL